MGSWALKFIIKLRIIFSMRTEDADFKGEGVVTGRMRQVLNLIFVVNRSSC